MDTFEDENPFEADALSSEASSASKVDLSEPPSPLTHPSRLLAPSSPPLARQYPSSGSQKQSQATIKTDYCCARDRTLHSGEDVEILVRNGPTRLAWVAHALAEDHGCAKDNAQLVNALYCLCHKDRGTRSVLATVSRC